MFETKILKLYLAAFELKLRCIRLLSYLSLLFKHVKQVFDVYSRLVYFSEKSAHIEKRPSHLQKQGLYHNEVSSTHRTHTYAMSCHQQVECHTDTEDGALPNIEIG